MRQLLFVAVHDDDYTDASDPDADLAIRIRPVGPVPLLPAGGAWGLAALWGVLGAMLLRARAARLRSRRG